LINADNRRIIALSSTYGVGRVGGVLRDPSGFVRPDAQLARAELPPVWAALERGPLPFETSIPGVFAARDVRAGSTKRVASAVGEGVSVVRSVHIAIGPWIRRRLPARFTVSGPLTVSVGSTRAVAHDPP
jgi:hypothetical protein